MIKFFIFFFIVDDMVIEVLKEGFHQTQKLVIACNMDLSWKATNKKWWTKPWLIKFVDKTFMCFTPSITNF
jgi:hypothetical protein